MTGMTQLYLARRLRLGSVQNRRSCQIRLLSVCSGALVFDELVMFVGSRASRDFSLDLVDPVVLPHRPGWYSGCSGCSRCCSSPLVHRCISAHHPRCQKMSNLPLRSLLDLHPLLRHRPVKQLREWTHAFDFHRDQGSRLPACFREAFMVIEAAALHSPVSQFQTSSLTVWTSRNSIKHGTCD